MKALRWLAAALVLMLAIEALTIAPAYWRARTPYEEQVMRRPTFDARYPAGWDRMPDGPEYADYAWFKGVDPIGAGAVMHLEDHHDKDPDAVVRDLVQKAYRATRVKKERLANGVEAQTFIMTTPMGEITDESRWWIFKGSNGHSYSASYTLPIRRPHRVRLEWVFRRILGSMTFKADGNSRPG